MGKRLDGGKFLRILRKREIYNGFELTDRGNERILVINPGVPAMLLSSISQFFGKSKGELLVDDVVQMYKSIRNLFPDGKIDYYEIRRFRKEKNLSFFDVSQYRLLEYYLKQNSLI